MSKRSVRAAIDAYIACAKHRCVGCRDGVGFTSMMAFAAHHSDGYGYCQATWERRQALKLSNQLENHA